VDLCRNRRSCDLDRALPCWSPHCAKAKCRERGQGKSIAVLPFENLSRDPDNAYFADGIQEENTDAIGENRRSEVISRNLNAAIPEQTWQFVRNRETAWSCPHSRGSVQKAVDQVRVNVQLINATTDAHLWAETYDRKLTDIFSVETDIAKTIAETLRARLSGAEQSAICRATTEDSEAHELYLKGAISLENEPPDYFKRASTTLTRRSRRIQITLRHTPE